MNPIDILPPGQKERLNELMASPPAGSDLYEEAVHRYLHSILHENVRMPWPINEPAPFQFSALCKHNDILWPIQTSWWYSQKAFFNESLFSQLCQGYVVYEGKLFRSGFFAIEGMAIDPIAHSKKIVPECYFGIHVAKRHVSDYLYSREFDTNALELQVHHVLKTPTPA
jgi:hypothetical protein